MRGERGFALPAALLVLALLSAIALSAASAATNELAIAKRLLARAQAIAAADGAIAVATYELLNERPGAYAGDWPRRIGVSVDGFPYEVFVESESGKLDLNAGRPDILAVLVRELTGEQGLADAAAEELRRLRQSAERSRRGTGGELAEPPALYDSRALEGPSLLSTGLGACIAPFVTVLAQMEEPEPSLAAPELRRALGAELADVRRRSVIGANVEEGVLTLVVRVAGLPAARTATLRLDRGDGSLLIHGSGSRREAACPG